MFIFHHLLLLFFFFFFQAEDGIRDRDVTGSDVCSSDLRSTTTTSYVVAVGGKPVMNLAFTAPSALPNRATVVGVTKAPSTSSFVITRWTVADERSPDSRSSVIWLLKFWTAQTRPASNRIPSMFRRSAPAIAALAPVVGLRA